jgi:hypothetical protein
MTDERLQLWQRIENFQLNEVNTEFSFSQRVARENGWSTNYTERVIFEYKRFIYLCCISEKGLTPSDPVDQVWHLHLTYTKSYWIDFCEETLNKDIHHNPTKGGEKEAIKFDLYYTNLNELYTQHFKAAPPNDIWQNNQQRFSDINFQRINLNKFWLVKKPAKKIFQQIVLIALVLIGSMSIYADAAYAAFVGIFIAVVLIVSFARKNKNSSNSNGCSAGGCGGDSSHDSGHHGGDSGCSGCSGSGCSGCGGGGD